MIWYKNTSGTGRDRYHHGNLREALIEAALELVAERGPAGFTFAEVARAVGVSPAAPYRHFRDRNALLSEMALRGFQQFDAELTHAWDDGRPEPLRALINCGRAYLAFARQQPAYYSAMFEVCPVQETDSELNQIGEGAMVLLRLAAETLCANLPKNQRPPSRMVALHIWSLCHGIASLFLGPAEGSPRRLSITPEDLLEAGILVYVRGLGLGGGGPIPPTA
ncbi:MAG: TetR/AcrR family transcriptional regulator [Candidatus Competibacteraceae bacterium]|nr:TetR/AcrR family transcriptional regulator [Candidatus Competibacteraceae bacterium]